MTLRDQLVAEARRLTTETGSVPSMDRVARAAHVSKGGLVHHFPSRAALIAALADDAIAEIDARMRTAAEHGRAAAAWLELALPSEEDVHLFFALGAEYRTLGEDGAAIVNRASAATARWQGLIAEEVADPDLALVIRLVGDGLTFNALIGEDQTAASAHAGAFLLSLKSRE